MELYLYEPNKTLDLERSNVELMREGILELARFEMEHKEDYHFKPPKNRIQRALDFIFY
jgi:hypothetical protein